MRIPYISLVAAGAIALGGCAYDGLGLGLGYGSDPYYGSPYYGGYGFGSPYYGWYDNYYYPGTGYYVYDSYRRPYAMTTTQRQYWSTRSPALRTNTSTRTNVRANWSAFDRKQARQTAREQRQQAIEDRRANRHNP